MGECQQCGRSVENKNSAGHYRDLCCSCIIDEAGRGGRPIPGCDCDRCQSTI